MKHKWIGILLAGLMTAGCLNANDPAKDAAPDKSSDATVSGASATAPKSDPNAKVTKTDTSPGTGTAVVAEGDMLWVLYTGKLAAGGKQFDTNMTPEGLPLPVKAGSGMVIKGFDEGLMGMKVDGARTINIPAHLGYGEAGSGDKIPANADLIFDVKVIGLIKKGDEGVWEKKTLKEGSGAGAEKGNKVLVHYTGTLLNGLKFDSSKDRNEPFEVTLGAGGVIKGWEEGLVGIKAGETRRLWIPPALGYGDQGSGEKIRGPQVLIFEIECLKVTK